MVTVGPEGNKMTNCLGFQYRALGHILLSYRNYKEIHSEVLIKPSTDAIKTQKQPIVDNVHTDETRLKP